MIAELARRVAELARRVAATERQLTWGQIIETAPAVTVRFAGDQATEGTINLKASTLVLTTGDKVLLARIGSQWVIVCTLGAT